MKAFAPSKLRCSTVPRCTRVVPAAASNGAQQAIGFDDLLDVIKAVDTSDVIELELKGRKFAMTVRKQEALAKPEPIYMTAPSAGPGACHCAGCPGQGVMTGTAIERAL